MQAFSQNSSGSVATPPATQGASTSQTHPRLTGPRSHPDLKTKQHATTQQDIRNIVVGVLEGRGNESGGLGAIPEDGLPGGHFAPT